MVDRMESDEVENKSCPMCGKPMTRETDEEMEPACQWVCLCGHHEMTTTPEDWGEA